VHTENIGDSVSNGKWNTAVYLALGFLVQQVNVNMLANVDFALSERLKEGGLATAVATNQTIATAEVQFKNGVLNEDLPKEGTSAMSDARNASTRYTAQACCATRNLKKANRACR
jgi:hypothetical protein